MRRAKSSDELDAGRRPRAGTPRLRARIPNPTVRWSTNSTSGASAVREAIEVGQRSSGHRRDRARRRRGARALGAVGEELGVALVQAGDGVAQPVGGEDLGPPASPLRVDLDQDDAPRSRRRRRRAFPPAHPLADIDTPAQRERVAEGRERLVPVRRVSGPQQRAPRGERSLAGRNVDAGRVVHDLRRRRRTGRRAHRRRGRRSRRRRAPRSRSRRSVARGARRRRRLGRSARRSARAPRPRGRRRTARPRVTRPSAPKTQSLRKRRSKAPPPARSVPEVRPAHEERVGSQREDVVDARSATSSASSSSARSPRSNASAPRADVRARRCRWSTNSTSGASAVA